MLPCRPLYPAANPPPVPRYIADSVSHLLPATHSVQVEVNDPEGGVIWKRARVRAHRHLHGQTISFTACVNGDEDFIERFNARDEGKEWRRTLTPSPLTVHPLSFTLRPSPFTLALTCAMKSAVVKSESHTADHLSRGSVCPARDWAISSLWSSVSACR